MSRGGKRINCGRKKINGKTIKIKLDEFLIDEINLVIKGKSQSDKIRNCITKGLIEHKKGVKFNESN